MIRRIVHFALHQPPFVVLGLLLFIGAGRRPSNRCPSKPFPTSPTPRSRSSCSTRAGAGGGREAGHHSTGDRASGVPNSIRMFSHTQFGAVVHRRHFDEKPSMFMARNWSRNACGPRPAPGVEPGTGAAATATGEIFRYRIDAPGLKSSEVRAIQDWTVSGQLKRGAGHRRRGFFWRADPPVRGAPRPGPKLRDAKSRATALFRPRTGQRQRRRRLCRPGPAAVPHPFDRPGLIPPPTSARSSSPKTRFAHPGP